MLCSKAVFMPLRQFYAIASVPRVASFPGREHDICFAGSDSALGALRLISDQ